MDDEFSDHRLAQLRKTVADHMARLASMMPNGGQVMAVQLVIVELEVLKEMLFDEGGILEGRALEHAFNALTAMDAWAKDMHSQLLRARLTNGL